MKFVRKPKIQDITSFSIYKTVASEVLDNIMPSFN